MHRFILCQNYMMFLLVLTRPPYFESKYCLFCGRRRVAVARYRMICLVLSNTDDLWLRMTIFFNYTFLCITLVYQFCFFFQNGNQCFCGNRIRPYPKKPEAECNKTCSGNTNEKCGGFWRISIFDTSKILNIVY